MTSQQELRDLIARAEARGAVVTVRLDESALESEGREIIAQVHVLGLKGVGPSPMAPISAAERLRSVLARRDRDYTQSNLLHGFFERNPGKRRLTADPLIRQAMDNARKGCWQSPDSFFHRNRVEYVRFARSRLHSLMRLRARVEGV